MAAVVAFSVVLASPVAATHNCDFEPCVHPEDVRTLVHELICLLDGKEGVTEKFLPFVELCYTGG